MLEHPDQLVQVVLHEGTFFGFQLNGVIWSRSVNAEPKEAWTLIYDPSSGEPEKKIGITI